MMSLALPQATADTPCEHLDLGDTPPGVQEACEAVEEAVGGGGGTGIAKVGVLPELSGVKCAGTWSLVAEGESNTVLVGGGFGFFWGFVGWQKTTVDVKMAFEFDCNTEINMVATGAGGVNRRVDLYRDGVLADTRPYTGITPDNSAKAVYAEAYNGGSGHGIIDPGEERPSASIACTDVDFVGENKDAITGIDLVSDTWTAGCLNIGISWVKVDGQEANELIERVMEELENN